MTWWQALLQYLLPMMLGLIPTIVLLNSDRKKALKDVDGADASASKTYMEAAKGMAEQNKMLLDENSELRKRLDAQDDKIQALTDMQLVIEKENANLKKNLLRDGARIAELERGVRVLCDQLTEAGVKAKWTLEKRTFGRLVSK
jgi:hypothetical protein